MKSTRLYYATVETIPAAVDGIPVLCLFGGIWFVHPSMESRIISDSQKFGLVATRLFKCTEFNKEAVSMLEWPEITT